ncbi:MAG: phosphohydrolase [Paenibacillus sp. RIFOXYA1_FULL_44_5]|nr:MAG: phosphohydrolase [Paenibacillus sp. RIFOXYA1_FULL_44_5]
MDLKQLMQKTKEQMPEKRWKHTQGVMDSAVILAERFGADTEQAIIAAVLHDYCKYWPIEQQKEMIREMEEFADLLNYDPQLLHGPAAAYVAKQELGIADPLILDAIRYHTSGRAEMTLLDKIICLADYIEPGRDFPGVYKIREIAEYSLERALIAGLDSTIQFLLEKGKKIYPLTIISRNELIEETRRLMH